MPLEPLYYKTSTNNYVPVPHVYNTELSRVEDQPTSPSGPVTPVLLRVSTVTATSDDGNVPGNVIDLEENTRWSAQGVGQKLFLDLGKVEPLHSVVISWYKGVERSYKATLLVDATQNIPITSNKAASTTIPFTDVKGQKITIVGNGSDVSDWNSINTVKIYGLATQTEPLPPQPTPADKDYFGTKNIFPTKTGGRVWNAPFSGTQRTLRSGQRDGNNDLCPLGQGTYTIMTNGEMKIEGSAPRVYVYDSARAKLFENVEITCYYKIVTRGNMESFQGFEIGVRGQHELSGTNARVYYAKHSISGIWSRMKEDVHPTAKGVTAKSGVSFDNGKWYGMKWIVRTIGNDVNMQSYQDLTDGANGGTWVKMDEYTDKASAPWAGYPIYRPTTPNCACRSVFARTDNAVDFRIKKFSIREI